MTDTEATVLYDIPEIITAEHTKLSENTTLQTDSQSQIDIGNTDENNTQIDSEDIKNNDNNEKVTSIKQKIQKKRANLIESDSENETQFVNSEKPAQINSELDLDSDNEIVTQLNSKSHKKRLTLIDSDSEDEKNIELSSQNSHENTAKSVNKSNKNRLAILDTDSEDETNDNTVKTNENKTKENEDIFPKEDQTQNKKSRLLQLCDSDSESNHENGKENTAEPVNKSNKRLKILNSDSEEETNENTVKTNENETKEDEDIFPKEDQTQKKKSRLLQLCDSDSEEENKTDLPPKISVTEDDIQHQTLQRLKTLCDSESSAEETEDKNEDIFTKNIIKQKRQRKKAEPKEKKMTGKEAQEQRREIISESQKMVRESRLHLPYHVPKQRTLQEFLQRRSLVKGSTKTPPNTPTGLSIKMCSKNIKTIQMKLKQKEKEIEEFYKSESEAEEEQELEHSKQEVGQESTQKVGNQMQENSNSEELAKNAENMDVDTNETQEITSEKLNKEKINEKSNQKINSEESQTEKNEQEKSSEGSQQNIIEEKEAQKINLEDLQTQENKQEESSVEKSSEGSQQNIFEEQNTQKNNLKNPQTEENNEEESSVEKSFEDLQQNIFEELKAQKINLQEQQTEENNQECVEISFENSQQYIISEQKTQKNSLEDPKIKENKQEENSIKKSSEYSQQNIIEEQKTQKINLEDPKTEENKQESSVEKSSEDSEQNMIEEHEAQKINLEDPQTEENKKEKSSVEKSSKDSQQNIIEEQKTHKNNLQDSQTEENKKEKSSVEKSSEDSQQNMIEEQDAGLGRKQFEKISEEFDEEMEVDEQSSINKTGEETSDTQIISGIIEKGDEQSSKNKNKEDSIHLQSTTKISENISEIREIEQNTLDEEITETIEENREEKIKELREILEKNLINSEPAFDEETEETELENIILDSQLESSQNSSQEAIRKMTEQEENKKKLAEIEEKLNKLNPLVALKGNFQPKLSGSPNELIILDEDIEKTKRVTNFMQRFLSHAVKKSNKKQYSILNTTKVPIEDLCEEPDKKIQIPGVRMKKLRLELTGQISKQRLTELKKRQEEEKMDNEDETYVGEKEVCELSNKVLDNEEEDELTDPSSSSEEEEEDDVEEKEKPRIKSVFMDDEAEESDEDENEEEMGNNEENKDEDEDESEIEDEDEETNLEPPAKKSLRRIVKPAEDSDEDTSSRPASSLNEEKRPIGVATDVFASQSNTNDNWKYNDDDIPAYQQPSDGLEKTPCKSATQKKDITHFLTPTLHLTALQGMSSATKSLQGSPNVNSFLPPEPSPLKLKHLVKTKLFSDQEEINLDELENLCSGKFTTQIENPEKRNNDLSTQENELLGICSGRFTGFTQNESSSSLESSIPVPKPTQSLDLLMNEDSQNFRLTIENDTTNYVENTNSEEQKLSIEESDQQNLKPQTNVSTSKYLKMKICSSSEDEEKENTAPKSKKLKKKRKYIIDDISITDEDDFEDNLEDKDLDEDIEEPRNVNYDSEENEIEIDEEQYLEEVEKPAKKASDFFEAEAELSESDWGSEDEDEKNLDDYEIEEGDEEKINEKKVQRELERMHMRNIRDDDQREVKMLQELLLEDGELHGTGRERKFRWKNADLLWNNDSDKPKEEEEEQEEIECEMQWRKMRHEREIFLQEHQNKRPSGEDEILNDSQLLKLGQKALKKSLFGSQSQNLSQKKTPIAESVATTEDIKLPFALANKRGSFLQRSETTLQRLAEITKISGNIGGPKNSKNFVFTAVDKTEVEGEEINGKKRKAEEGTPKILKKLRIADMSPNVQKRKKKLPI